MLRKILVICFLINLLFSCKMGSKKIDQVAETKSDLSNSSLNAASNVSESKTQKPNTWQEEVNLIEAKLLEAEAREDHNQKGINFMKLANIHHEKSGDLRTAIFNAQRSVSSFAMAKDTSQIANMLKYQASLLASNGQYDLAIGAADEAIRYYKEVDFDRGIAAMYLNKAQTYLAEKDYSKSEEFYEQAIKILKEKPNENTIFLYQLHGLKLYKESENNRKFQKLVKICEASIASGKIRPNLLNQFESIKNK